MYDKKSYDIINSSTFFDWLFASEMMMKCTNQTRSCHAERGEASLCPSSQTLRCAQGDKTLPISFVKIH